MASQSIDYYKKLLLTLPPDIPASSLRPAMLACPVPLGEFKGPPTEGAWRAPISSDP